MTTITKIAEEFFAACEAGRGRSERATQTDNVYVMQFSGNKISHMTKIWHSGLAMKELG
jgi:hypothetical protein